MRYSSFASNSIFQSIGEDYFLIKIIKVNFIFCYYEISDWEAQFYPNKEGFPQPSHICAQFKQANLRH